MTVEEIRQDNLRLLKEEEAEDNAAQLGRLIDVDATHIRNMIKGIKNMGAKLARQIEKKRGMARGSMDAPNLGRGQQPTEGGSMKGDSLAAVVFREFTKAEQEEAIRYIFEIRKRRPSEKKGV